MPVIKQGRQTEGKVFTQAKPITQPLPFGAVVDSSLTQKAREKQP